MVRNGADEGKEERSDERSLIARDVTIRDMVSIVLPSPMSSIAIN